MAKKSSELSQLIKNFLNEIKREPPATLTDHIRTKLKPTRRSEERSYRSAATAVLGTDHTYRYLIGTKIFPSFTSRGPVPKWAIGVSPMADKVPVPDWTKATELVLIEESGLLIGSKPEDKAAVIKAFSVLPARAYKILTGAYSTASKNLTDLVIERDDALSKAFVAQQECVAALKRLDKMEKQVEQLVRLNAHRRKAEEA